MSCLGERKRENISACFVVMTCKVEQDQLVSTLGASGSITGTHDPEHSVSEGWPREAGVAPQAAQPRSQMWTGPDPAQDPGLSRLCPPPLPASIGVGAGPPGFSPISSWASSQLSSRLG